MFKLARFLKPYKKELILGPLFKVLEAIFELLVPIVMIKIIDIGVKSSDIHYVISRGSVILVLGLVGFCSTLVCQYLASVASQGTGTILRKELFSHINSFSFAELDKFSSSKLLTRLTSDINQMQLAVASLIRLTIRVPLLIIGSIVMSFTIDPKLALVILIISPFISGVIYLIMNKALPVFKKVQANLEKIVRSTGENLSGMRVIRAFNVQNKQIEKFNSNADELSENYKKGSMLSALQGPLTALIVDIGIIAILWQGSFEVNAGSLTQGEIIALVNYMTQLNVALAAAAKLVDTFVKAAASASRINEIFDTKPSVTYPEKDAAELCIKDGSSAVNINNVTFSFAGMSKAIDSVSMDIPYKSSIGIIGGTGSGKSTIVSLIPRFYDTEAGDIEIFGANVKELSFRSLKRSVYLCPQKSSVLSGTVRENLLLANPNATDDMLILALKDAQAYQFVEQKGGLDAMLEQNGKNLSGGQKQRLSIARAFASDAKILIFDDCLSALDAATEKDLLEALRKKQQNENITVIIISQRINAIKDCDHIYVMENGKTIGDGTHESLLDDCMTYKELFNSQELGDQNKLSDQGYEKSKLENDNTSANTEKEVR